jgi:two-component system chemotaxis response regulator CheY
LVVDDDDDARAAIVDYLELLGHAPIYQAKDGDEGFASLQIHSDEIAIVVSDWEMPRLAGIELLKRIRNDEKLGQTPFIMVTSQSSIERVKLKQAIDSDVDNYLLKPFRVDDLRAKVDEVLKRAKKRVGLEHDLARGEAALATGQWGPALKIFQKVVEKDPHNVQAFLGMATAQHHLAPEKAIPMATQYIRTALKINPSCVQGHVDLALTFESAMSLEKAIACLKEALQHCALSEQIHFHLGRLLLRRGNRAEGAKELRKALELNPDFKEAAELLEGGKE